MNKVYILYHSYTYYIENQEIEYTEVKLLGVYSSEILAKEAESRYKKLEGFNEYPESCFSIEKYTVDEDSNFSTGFFSWFE